MYIDTSDIQMCEAFPVYDCLPGLMIGADTINACDVLYCFMHEYSSLTRVKALWVRSLSLILAQPCWWWGQRGCFFPTLFPSCPGNRLASCSLLTHSSRRGGMTHLLGKFERSSFPLLGIWLPTGSTCSVLPLHAVSFIEQAPWC